MSTSKTSNIEIWVLTYEFEDSYDTNPIISLHPNKKEGLTGLIRMLSVRSEEGYEKLIDKENEISYGNGDMFISLVKKYIDISEINKYITIPVWVLISQGCEYSDNIILYHHKEDSIEEQLIRVQMSEYSYEKEETEDRITYHNEDYEDGHITIVKHYIKL